ncbi:hypothetical protein FQR65_LT19238 [Abscondita terminalis]|nr:hypothetical protein FQR65_LT19238 [Abscondita terminalis]
MDANNIDCELLINAIQERPAIWDMRSSDYSDKIKRKRSWEEVVILFSREDDTEEEKKKLGILLQKKWKNVRDRYSREVQQRKGKSGDGFKKKSPYVYTQQLSFLEDTIKNRTTSNSMDNNEQESQETENPEDSSTSLSLRSELSTETTNIGKKRRLNPVETKLIEALDRKAEERKKKEKINEEDDDKLFLLSLLPSLKSIPLHFKLNARMDIMQSINKYFISPPTTCSSNIPYHTFVQSANSHSSYIPYHESVPSTSCQPPNSFQSQTELQIQHQSPRILTTLLPKQSTGNSQANLALQHQLSPQWRNYHRARPRSAGGPGP